MSKIWSSVGTLKTENEGQFVTVKNTDTGIAVYGPYEKLGKGKYSVKFCVSPDANAARDLVCCRIDIVGDYGVLKLMERTLSVGELRDCGSEIEAAFELRKPSLVEYRVFALGATGFRVAYERRALAIFDHEFNSSHADGAGENLVFRANYGRISFLEGAGAKFSITSRDIIATVNNIKFHIEIN